MRIHDVTKIKIFPSLEKSQSYLAEGHILWLCGGEDSCLVHVVQVVFS
jgi:hypothetical protein